LSSSADVYTGGALDTARYFLWAGDGGAMAA